MKIFQTTPPPSEPSLGIQLIILQLIGSALVGGIVTLILREGIDYIRRPKLSMNLEFYLKKRFFTEFQVESVFSNLF